MRRGPLLISGLLVLGAAALGGCTKKITIAQYPAFYDGSIKAIAVTPFRNQTRVRSAGNVISDKLAGLLAANKTYAVYNRNHHAVLSDERDLQLDLGEDPQKIEAMFQKLGDVQAILTGAVSIYHSTTRTETKQRPVYAYNRYTKKSYISHYVPYEHTRYDVTVEVSAVLLRRDGTTIHSTPGPFRAHRYAEGDPPRKDPYALLGEATDAVTWRLLEEFAVIRRQIKLDPTKALRTASELFENKWTYTDRFAPDSDKMYVVVTLPRSCDRNRFEIRIVQKDQREYLATEKIVWDGRYNSPGYVFSPRTIAEKGGGRGVYTIKFFSGPEPVFTRDFRIE